MHGRYLLDTNIIIYAINRKLTLPPAQYSLSIITEMELLSFPLITSDEERDLRGLLQKFQVLGLDEVIKERAIAIRRASSLKLPDSIISATAAVHGYKLVSNDEGVIKGHEEKVLTLDELLAR